jgi:PhnB protein
MSDDTRRDKNLITAIAPFLSFRRGARTIEFYKAAFGADELFRLESDAGHVAAQ